MAKQMWVWLQQDADGGEWGGERLRRLDCGDRSEGCVGPDCLPASDCSKVKNGA